MAMELESALTEDRLVQIRFSATSPHFTRTCPNVSSRRLYRACRRPGHVARLRALNTHHRVVLADRGRELVQIVATSVTDARMSHLDVNLDPPPALVKREVLQLGACCTLRGQPSLGRKIRTLP